MFGFKYVFQLIFVTFLGLLVVGCGGDNDLPEATNFAPTAAFSASAISVFSDDGAVTFTDESSDIDVGDTIVSWEWDFGDGTTSTEQNPTHTYTTPTPIQTPSSEAMPNVVTLIVTDSRGARSEPVTVDITVVSPNLPIVGLSVEDSNVQDWQGMTITTVLNDPAAEANIAHFNKALEFDFSTSINVASYSLDYGDGSAADTGTTPTTLMHTYTTPGTYQAVLTLTSPEAGVAFEQVTIHAIAKWIQPIGTAAPAVAADNEGKIEYGSPMLSNDQSIVYIGAGEDNLETTMHAFNVADGTTVTGWPSFTISDRIRSVGAVDANGVILIGSDDDNLYAINPDGTEKWRADVDSDVRGSSPAVINGVGLNNNGIVYQGSNSGSIYAINIDDGSEIWQFTSLNGTDDDATIDPVLSADGSRLYFGTGGAGNVYVLDTATGLVAADWDIAGGDTGIVPTDGGFAATSSALNPTAGPGSDGVFYVSVQTTAATTDCPVAECQGLVRAYDINPADSTDANSIIHWTRRTESRVQHMGPVVGPNGVVYIASTNENGTSNANGQLFALHPDDGSDVWAPVDVEDIRSTIAIDSNENLIFGSEEGTLYVVASATGEIGQQYDLGARVFSSPLIANDGIVYVGLNGYEGNGDEGFVAALDLGATGPSTTSSWPMRGLNAQRTQKLP